MCSNHTRCKHCHEDRYSNSNQCHGTKSFRWALTRQRLTRSDPIRFPPSACAWPTLYASTNVPAWSMVMKCESCWDPWEETNNNDIGGSVRSDDATFGFSQILSSSRKIHFDINWIFLMHPEVSVSCEGGWGRSMHPGVASSVRVKRKLDWWVPVWLGLLAIKCWSHYHRISIVRRLHHHGTIVSESDTGDCHHP